LRKILFAAASVLIATAAFAQAADPYLWLENVEGAKPLAQVKQWNAETEAVLTKMPGYEEHRQRALAMRNDPQQIATPRRGLGGLVAKHWVEAEPQRRAWRVSPVGR